MSSMLAASVLCVALAAVGCGSGAEAGEDHRVRVVATTPHAADLARAVGGDRASVTAMLPLIADPHDYEVRPRDVKALADADLVVRAGGELDDWLGEAIESSGTDARVVTLADHVRREGDDPH